MKILEQLIGAQSLFATFRYLIHLRNLGVVSTTIAIVWMLSPIGGQALLRLVTTLPAKDIGVTTYLAPNAFYDPFITFQGSWLSSYDSYTSGLYTTALLTIPEVQMSSQDLWGNPKIPTSAMVSNTSDAYGWAMVSDDTTSGLWHSRIGVPVSGGSYNENKTFQVFSSAMEVQDCSLVNTTTERFLETVPEMKIPANDSGASTLDLWDLPGGQFGYPSSFLRTTDQSWQDLLDGTAERLKIFHGVRLDVLSEQPRTPDGQDVQICLAECWLAPLFIEAKVFCNSSVCAVDAIRSANSTLSVATVRPALEEVFGYGSWSAFGSAQSPDLPSMADNAMSILVALADPLYFTAHLNIVFNTMLQVSSKAFPALLRGTYFPEGYTRSDYIVETPAEIVSGHSYVCHRGWLVTALAVGVVLEATAVTTVVLHRLTVVPDLFGYVSSMTMNNSYCESAGVYTNSAIDGLDRTKALGKQKFQIVDIQPHNEVGKLAFIPINRPPTIFDESQTPVGKIIRRRLYI